MQKKLDKSKLSADSLNLLELFQKRFGIDYDEEIIAKLSGVEIKYGKKPYDMWWGTVDRKGNITVNTMAKNKGLDLVANHELLHKVNNTVDENGESISYFEEYSEEYTKIALPFVEFFTEWLTSEISTPTTSYYMLGETECIKTNGQKCSYSKGTNLITALTTVIDEKTLLDVYTGKIPFETLVEYYDNRYGEGEFKRYLQSLSELFYTTIGIEKYSEAMKNILAAYSKKQAGKSEYTQEELDAMHSEIQKLYSILPCSLLEGQTSELQPTLEGIKDRYECCCNSNGIMPREFSHFEIEKDKKARILEVNAAGNMKPEIEKTIFGVAFKCDETMDLRNNLYRIVFHLFKRDVGETIIKGEDKYIEDVLNRICSLPPNLDTDLDLERYFTVYEYINTYLKMNMLEQTENGTMGERGVYMNYRSILTNMRANSIFDAKKGRILGGIDESAKVFNTILATNINLNESLVTSENISPEEHKRLKRLTEGLKIDEEFLTLDDETYSKHRKEQLKKR